MSDLTITLTQPRRAYRLAVSTLFFLQGLCFASWASRIPNIQQSLALSDSQLGLVLLALPVGSLLSLPLSGWLVTHFGSKRMAANALLLYGLLLPVIGLSNNITLLLTALVFFGVAGNTANIAINTQAVGVEILYGRNIMASFHGLWSLAGFTAAGVGAYMIGHGIIPLKHFVFITAFILVALAAALPYMLPAEERPATRQPIFVKPDRPLLLLGLISFCCMICEGAMADWSGIYFRKVVQADKHWIGAGYTAFMCTMATGRFLADWVTLRIGARRMLAVSGLLIALGLGLAASFPYLVPAIVGFLIVGFGVSAVVPLVYSEAGRSATMPAGMALAAVSSIGFIGFLVGPPLIGLVAGLFSLRISFIIIALMGLAIVGLARKKG